MNISGPQNLMPRTLRSPEKMEDDELPEALHEWLQVQHPLPQPPPTLPLGGGGWDTAVVSDDYPNPEDESSIFPPSHHEGLDVSPPDVQATEDPSSGSDDEEDQRPQVGYGVGRRWRVRFEILRAGVLRLACRVRRIAGCAGGFWSIASVTGLVAAVLLSFLYMRVRRWRQRIHQERKHRLVLLREKDERINQLLLQIAQMNEVVSARRRVPVIKVS